MTSLVNRLKAFLKPVRSAPSQTGPSRWSRNYRPRLEVLEDRLALSTLELSGTFNMEFMESLSQTGDGTAGADLASIMGHDNGWRVTLSDVGYQCVLGSPGAGGWPGETSVYAASFQFEFSGVDAALLNNTVAQHFTGGIDSFFRAYGDGFWDFTIVPTDLNSGVSFIAYGSHDFPLDPTYGTSADCPVIDSAFLHSSGTSLEDRRPGNNGALTSFLDGVVLVRDGVPAGPTLAITDVSRQEGNKGTTAFVFTVTLSSPSSDPVTVRYKTADGTATIADRDYQATSGTLTFAPGETSKTITVRVNGDRKREGNETFSIDLFDAVFAGIADESGVGTIFNDD